MNHNYRIRENDGRFYPQNRTFWMWTNYCDIGFGRPVDLWFPTLEEAREFLKRQQAGENSSSKNEVVYHEP